MIPAKLLLLRFDARVSGWSAGSGSPNAICMILQMMLRGRLRGVWFCNANCVITLEGIVPKGR